jgi:hypothetical protein
MPFPVYQYMIILVVSLRIWKGRSLFMNISVREHRALKNWIYVAKFTTLMPLVLLS